MSRDPLRRAIESPLGRALLSAVSAAAATFSLAKLAELGVAPAVWAVRPFGILGFVFGNIHQGDALISYGTLAVTLFIVVLVALTVVGRRLRRAAASEVH